MTQRMKITFAFREQLDPKHKDGLIIWSQGITRQSQTLVPNRPRFAVLWRMCPLRMGKRPQQRGGQWNSGSETMCRCPSLLERYKGHRLCMGYNPQPSHHDCHLSSRPG